MLFSACYFNLRLLTFFFNEILNFKHVNFDIWSLNVHSALTLYAIMFKGYTINTPRPTRGKPSYFFFCKQDEHPPPHPRRKKPSRQLIFLPSVTPINDVIKTSYCDVTQVTSNVQRDFDVSETYYCDVILRQWLVILLDHRSEIIFTWRTSWPKTSSSELRYLK